MRPPASTNSLAENIAGSRFPAARSAIRSLGKANRGLPSTTVHPRAPWSCPRRPCRARRVLAPRRLEAAPPAPAPQLLRPSASSCPCVRMAPWLPEERDPTDPRNGLLQQFQALADELRGEVGQPGDIAARPRKAGDESSATGSATPAKTMGTVLVACLAAWAAAVLGATMTSTLSATSSAARAGNRSGFPSASRYSITTLRPST